MMHTAIHSSMLIDDDLLLYCIQSGQLAIVYTLYTESKRERERERFHRQLAYALSFGLRPQTVQGSNWKLDKTCSWPRWLPQRMFHIMIQRELQYRPLRWVLVPFAFGNPRRIPQNVPWRIVVKILTDLMRFHSIAMKRIETCNGQL